MTSPLLLSPAPSYRLLSTIRVFDNERERQLECCYLPIKLHTCSSTSVPRTLSPLSLSSHFSSTLFSVQIFSASKCQHQNITLQDAHFSSKEDRIYNVNYFRKETSYLFEPTLCVYIKLRKVPLFY